MSPEAPPGSKCSCAKPTMARSSSSKGVARRARDLRLLASSPGRWWSPEDLALDLRTAERVLEDSPGPLLVAGLGSKDRSPLQPLSSKNDDITEELRSGLSRDGFLRELCNPLCGGLAALAVAIVQIVDVVS